MHPLLMPLAAGDKLGPYEILAPLGAGGMGDVYKGRDTRLQRTIAIKILKTGGRERFEREARCVSALNHLHICDLYDIGSQDGLDFLIMEYLEGDTLARRLEKGPLPVKQALAHGIEIADALAAAHRAGIVHRDLKPANIMLVSTGAKLLDFGLAKAAMHAAADSTATLTITRENVLIGTLNYMAPEQFEGKGADVRSDIFAFGLVLYEMVAGRRAFTGDNAASLLTAMLTTDPPSLTATQPLAPCELDRVVRKCLEKDPDRRWQSAQDIVWELEWLVQALCRTPVPIPSPRSHSGLRWLFPVALAMLLLAVAPLFRAPPTQPMRALSMVAPPEHSILESAISPDGSRIAFSLVDPSGTRQLCVRPLDSMQPRVIPGTDGASNVFWSPDGRYLGFFAQGLLKRVSADAGDATVQTVADAPDGRGGAWSPDNVIVFAPNIEAGLSRVPATGGEVIPFTRLDRAGLENSHRWPQFLPDGRKVIFLVRSSAPEKQGIYTAMLDGSERKLLFHTPYAAIYAASHGGGSMLFADGEILMSRHFNPRTLQFSDEAKPVTSLIEIHDNKPHVSAAPHGPLIYQVRQRPAGSLTWQDRSGKMVGAPLKFASEPYLRISPDDHYAATYRVDRRVGSGDIWILDLQRGTETRFTSDSGYEWTPIWSPDGGRIAFGSNRNGPMDLYIKSVQGSEEARIVLASANRKIPSDWSPDGRLLVFAQESAGKKFGLYALPLDSEPKPFVLVDSEFDEIHGVVSPDGRWLAYSSNETGLYEIYVRPFAPHMPGVVTSTRVSLNGGTQPIWRRDGQELFYVSYSGLLMAVPINHRGTDFSFGHPNELFTLGMRARGASEMQRYAVSRDGARFLVGKAPEDVSPSPITVLLGWSR